MNTVCASLVLCLAVAAYGFPGSQIVGGKDAPAGKFPYQVSLKRSGSHFCGGSILNSRYILTAAHCVSELDSGKNVQVYVGTNKLNAGGVAYGVEKIIAHRDYSPSRLVNDVALIRVNKNIAFNSLVQPIKLASGSTTYEGASCVLSGWGRIAASGSVPNNLQYINLVVETQAKCKKVQSDLQASHICTYTKIGEGACNGDSGGPLVSNGKQIGIVSYGTPCAIGHPDVYTRVSSFASWIQAQQTYLMNGDVAEPPVDAVYIV